MSDGALLAIGVVGAVLTGVAAGLIATHFLRWGPSWQRLVTAALLGLLLSQLFFAIIAE